VQNVVNLGTIANLQCVEVPVLLSVDSGTPISTGANTPTITLQVKKADGTQYSSLATIINVNR
jgi:hypothetical protein